MEGIIRTKTLITIAEQFGLPCIVRETEVTILGEMQTIIFNRVKELDICQIQQII